MILPRRTLITGLAALLAAPAVVRAENIMRVMAPRAIVPQPGQFIVHYAGAVPIRFPTLISPYAMQRECEAFLRFLGGVQWDYRALSLRPPYPTPAKINRLPPLCRLPRA